MEYSFKELLDVAKQLSKYSQRAFIINIIPFGVSCIKQNEQ